MSIKKIALATNDKLKIAKRLGHCKYFAIYTISPDDIIETEYIANTFTGHGRHKLVQVSSERQNARECNHESLSQALEGCEVIIAGGMGNTAMDKFNECGINAYIVESKGTLDDIIREYIKGELVINRDAAGCCGHKHKQNNELD